MRPVAVLGLALVATGCDLVFPPGAGPGVDGPDAPLDGTPTDRDGDGIANGDDRCPDAFNPLQLDEDGDDVPDACDVCVGLSDVNQADEDGDGIGDRCDLFLGDPSTVVIARMFIEGGNAATWDLVGGEWSVNALSAVQTNTGDIDASAFWSGSVPPTGTVWVEAGFVANAFGGDASVGVWLDADATAAPPDDGHRCDLHDITAVGVGTEVVHRIDGFETPVAAGSAPVGLGTPVLLQGEVTPSGFACTVSRGQRIGTSSALDGTRTVGLHTDTASGTFLYVVVYHQP